MVTKQEEEELIRILSEVLKAAYDVNQTKPGMIKIINSTVVDLKRQLQLARLDAKIEELKRIEPMGEDMPLVWTTGEDPDLAMTIPERIAELTAQKAHLTTKGVVQNEPVLDKSPCLECSGYCACNEPGHHIKGGDHE